MNQWLKRIRGAVGTGVIWALVWAPIAVIVGTQIIDPTNAMDEMWVMIGALPGFLSGVTFSIVLGVAAQRRKLADLSVPRTAAWGALAGLIIGTLPFLLGDTGGRPMALLATVTVSSITVLSAVSAAASLALAQRAEKRESLQAARTPDAIGGANSSISQPHSARQNVR